SPPGDDPEFLRRAFLDITGRIPSLERTTAFLDSRDPDKRDRLIEELLASAAYGQHFGTMWRNLIVPRSGISAKTSADTFSPGLAERFNGGVGWNRVVFELLTAEGEVRNPQTTFILANSENFQPQPNQLAASSSRLFLGVQLQCAECHDHPFTT